MSQYIWNNKFAIITQITLLTSCHFLNDKSNKILLPYHSPCNTDTYYIHKKASLCDKLKKLKPQMSNAIHPSISIKLDPKSLKSWTFQISLSTAWRRTCNWHLVLFIAVHVPLTSHTMVLLNPVRCSSSTLIPTAVTTLRRTSSYREDMDEQTRNKCGFISSESGGVTCLRFATHIRYHPLLNIVQLCFTFLPSCCMLSCILVSNPDSLSVLHCDINLFIGLLNCFLLILFLNYLFSGSTV